MQLPKENQSYAVRVRYGTYVARRLRRAKLATLASAVLTATADVRSKGRARDDANDAVQEALADRDAADALLDLTASTARAAIAGRAPNALKNEPYTQIFPDGIEYYTASPLDLCVSRYQELTDRLQKYLPPDDPCLQHIPTISEASAEFEAGAKALTDARRVKALLSTDLDSSEDAWNRLLQRTYGSLIEKFGKGTYVESFFPKLGRANDDDQSPNP